MNNPKEPLHELSLFSGLAGFSLGFKLADLTVRTVGYVENEPYCQQIIQARIKDGFLDNAPIFGDIRAFDGAECRGVVDIITAGFPCQPHSVAGKRLGAADHRNLWPDTLRVIREVGPEYVILENVPGLGTGQRIDLRSIETLRQLSLFDQNDRQSNVRRIDRSDFTAHGLAFMGTVSGELSDIGYDAEWHLVPAAALGAPHLRWRWWCFAYAKNNRHPGAENFDAQRSGNNCAHQPGRDGEGRSAIIRYGSSGDVADAQHHQQGITHIPEPWSNRATFVTRNGETRAVADSGQLSQGRPCKCGQPEGGQSFSESSRCCLFGTETDVVHSQGQRSALWATEGQFAGGSTGGSTEFPDANGASSRYGNDGTGTDLGNTAEETGDPLRSGRWWATEPNVGRVANGVTARVDRLKTCGNGIVPAVVAFFLGAVHFRERIELNKRA